MADKTFQIRAVYCQQTLGMGPAQPWTFSKSF
jgi:hypothetical protein